MRLVLGTAAFGQNYGFGSGGKVKFHEVEKIIEIWKRAGATEIDTAVDYGNAHCVLGQIGIEDFAVHTKLPHVDLSSKSWRSFILTTLDQAFSDLRVSEINGLLLHSLKNLNDERASDLIDFLRMAQSDYPIARLGASIYGLDINPAILNSVDYIQMPGNFFDRRFYSSVQSLDVYIRSIFLQGLLLNTSRPAFFDQWKSELNRFDVYAGEFESPTLAAINFVNKVNPSQKVVVGVQSPTEAEQIIRYANFVDDLVPIPEVGLVSEDLIFPHRWAV